MPDYNVSVAEVLIPGSELSQHIRYLIPLVYMYISIASQV